MSNLIKINNGILDSTKFKKQCEDFQKFDDGTITGDYHYCNLSLYCRQIGIDLDGKAIPMESHYLTVIAEDGETYYDLFCTGMHDLRPYKERLTDDKVS